MSCSWACLGVRVWWGPGGVGVKGARPPEQGRVVGHHQLPQVAADPFALRFPGDRELGQIAAQWSRPHQSRALVALLEIDAGDVALEEGAGRGAAKAALEQGLKAPGVDLGIAFVP